MPNDDDFQSILKNLNFDHQADYYDIKEWLKCAGCTIKDLAISLHCTPQHLGAVLNGRANLTKSMEKKIREAVSTILLSSKVELKLTFSGSDMLEFKDMLPRDIDLNETIKSYLYWLGGYFQLATASESERGKIIKNTLEDGFNPLNEPIEVYCKGKRKKICLPIQLEIKGPFIRE